MNFLLSIPGIKNCIFHSFSQSELLGALAVHFGVTNMWNKIFTEYPNTENDYLSVIRIENKKPYLHYSMLLLNDNTEIRSYIETYVSTESDVEDWKTGVFATFGAEFYNNMMLEILQQYANQYWMYRLNEYHIYGSSRLGLQQRNLPIARQDPEDEEGVVYYSYTSETVVRVRGQKRYELSNHLGNVLAVITDRRLQSCDADELSYYEAEIVSVTDYYPFGMFPKTTNLRFGSFSNAALAVEIKERSYSVSSYRYGFNGKEKDSEGMGGGGSTYDYGFRIYNPQLGKFLSVDPLFQSFPWFTPYQFAGNMPIAAIDLDGMEAEITINSGSFEELIIKAIEKGDIKRAIWLATFALQIERPGDIDGSTYVYDLYGGEPMAASYNYNENNKNNLTVYNRSGEILFSANYKVDEKSSNRNWLSKAIEKFSKFINFFEPTEGTPRSGGIEVYSKFANGSYVTKIIPNENGDMDYSMLNLDELMGAIAGAQPSGRIGFWGKKAGKFGPTAKDFVGNLLKDFAELHSRAEYISDGLQIPEAEVVEKRDSVYRKFQVVSDPINGDSFVIRKLPEGVLHYERGKEVERGRDKK